MYPCDEAGLREDQDLRLDRTLGWVGQSGKAKQSSFRVAGDKMVGTRGALGAVDIVQWRRACPSCTRLLV